MARVDLRCGSCGYMFFVSDVQLAKPEGVKCPSCLAPVGLTGPTPGGPRKKTVRVLATGSGGGDPRMKLYILIGGGVVVIAIAAVIFMFSGGKPREDDDEARRTAPAPVNNNPGPARPIVKETPKPAPAVNNAPARPAPTTAPTPAPVTKEAPKTPAPAAPVDLPPEIVKALREQLLSLKEWHVSLALSAPEKTRVDGLLSTGKGGAGDVEFLKSLIEGPRLRVVREEAGMIQEAYARLEKEALESLPVDKVTMNDGRILHGKIVEETADLLKLERKFAGGVAGVMPLAKPGVKEILKGKGLGSEFKTRWDDALKGGPAKMGALLTWCKESTLPLQASLTAYALLVDNPGMTEARAEAGFATDPVSRMLEAEKQGGFITHEGRRWVPKELKDKLLRDGFVIMDGRWVSKKDKIISVPGLFRYETQNDKPVVIAGTVAHDEVVNYVTVQDLTTNSFTEKPEIKLVRRFFVSAPMVVTPTRTNGPGTPEVETIIVTDKGSIAAGNVTKGEVFLTVPVGAPMLEASVMTSAEVKPGGSIAVSLILDGNRTPLYNCGTKEDKSHKIPPELIRGKTEVQLVAEISSRATYRPKTEKRRVRGLKKDGNYVLQKALDVIYNQLVPEYQAVLFPSNSNTVEVFRLTVATGDPSPGLDKLFENAKDVLK
ncbi:MAG TPA: hypothetical protein VF950_09180 [Planctomycetota bacterium]